MGGGQACGWSRLAGGLERSQDLVSWILTPSPVVSPDLRNPLRVVGAYAGVKGKMHLYPEVPPSWPACSSAGWDWAVSASTVMPCYPLTFDSPLTLRFSALNAL